MNQAQRLRLLQNTGKTVFSAQFLRRVWQLPDTSFKITVKRMVDGGLLLRLAKGIYAFSKDYNIYELANTLVVPSYISFNSALFYHGVSFQVSQEIESAANFSYRRKIDNRICVYYKIKKSLFYDTDGVISGGSLAMATVERAVADCFYVQITPNLDNIDKINLARLKLLADKYPLRVQKQIQSIL